MTRFMLKEFLAAVAKYRNNYTHSNPGVRDMLRWIATRKAPPAAKPCPLAANDPAALRANRDRPTLTWVGHSTFLVQLEGANFLTDPIFTDRASPFKNAGPRRVTPVGLKLDDLPQLDFVLVSHDHYDHLNRPTIKALWERQRENPPLFIVPAGLGTWFRKRGFSRVAELGWWESLEVAGVRVHGVPVQHWSQRIPWLINRTHWNGFVVEGKGGKLFFPGDTGYSRDFADIRERLGAMTVALLPIGAYEPRWFLKPMHTDPEDAVRIHQDLGASLSVAMHWGTFVQTDEPFDEPPMKLRETLKRLAVSEEDFIVMAHGETRDLGTVWGDAPAASVDSDLGA
jgi:N-acyl-phosphatidylethanolamine-hydrolysing phospholipase D